MSGPNGNLSLEERSKLAPGTAVVWQTERGSERHGVVSHTNGSGSLVTMEDGGAADYSAFLRLASWTPGKGQQSPAKAPETPAPANTGGEAPEPARALRKGFVGEKGNTPWNKGKPKVDAERWLACVLDVRAKMDLRQSIETAVSNTVQDYPDLRLTFASFQWWQRRFIREGALTRRPKSMPRREAKAPTNECQGCANARQLLDDAGKGIAELNAQLSLSREVTAKLEDERNHFMRRVAELEGQLRAAGQQTLRDGAAAAETILAREARIAELEAAKAPPAPTEPLAALAACLVRIAALAPATQGRIVRAMAEIVGVGK